ncbi:ATP-grasp domain-containing protein [Candidatus Uabimicrobium amorphum]|uniref:ATP-grasp domain-containing protein n=1 Tax=Uabimicrobium amorphum TaxID=2596890 RepID=A0A5S9IKW6_UABAM|nr:ATP-grasp domain-containing protein [Candidatus Uabimicrobium amorphum]BBM83421.1 hypothetical protein UABAM_01773 [Candidatus Uabimicrobium amorphum]
MNRVRWIIQNNLISPSDLSAIKNACQKLGVGYKEVCVIPFSNELPEFPQDEVTNIYYGATAFISELHKKSKPLGIFFDEERFSLETAMNNWQEYMLNSEGKITTLQNFSESSYPLDSKWFIRPNADDKSFAGEVIRFADFKDWYQRLITQNVSLNVHSKILVAPPYNIKKEWRNFVVNGKVITSTLYRRNFQVHVSDSEAPQQVVDFVEKRCKEFMPHKLFAMDIALCGDEYYVIECNCLNSIGFYGANIFVIVKAITEYVASINSGVEK